MLGKIKCQFFYKFLSSFINDKLLFEIIKYNKFFQNALGINLHNYKLLSGKYVEYEAKDTVKIYDMLTNSLLYEGGFLKGKKNGKGKEYHIFELFEYDFEGEFFDGKRHGKGKESREIYFFDAPNDPGEALKFQFQTRLYVDLEGEFLNGKKWNVKKYDENGNIMYEIKNGQGIVKEYDRKKRLIFDGEYINGEKNGKAKEYRTYDGYCECEYVNGEKTGKAKDYDKNGNVIFEGEYYKGKKWNGKVFDKINNKTYELKNGNGFFKEYYDSGRIKYEGGYLNGERNGKGKEYYKNKLIFESEYLSGKKNGKGKEYCYEDGKLIFEGEYLYDKKIKGKQYKNGKLAFEGEFFQEEIWNGKGYDEKGNLIYELINGNGKIKEYNYDFNQIIFEGEYLNGKRNGKGREYNDEGQLIYEGEFLNGKRNGKGKEYENGQLIFEGEFLDDKRKD